VREALSFTPSPTPSGHGEEVENAATRKDKRYSRIEQGLMDEAGAQSEGFAAISLADRFS
jgi:hypothetical protein